MSGQEPDRDPRLIAQVLWALVVLILGLAVIIAWAVTR